MSSPAHDSAPRLLDLIDGSVRHAAEAGVIMQTADSSDYSGRHVELEGDTLLNFGGCSYLGLELRPELKQGAIDAIHRYGTQFSFSRAYLESPLYRELEALLDEMTGGHVLVTPSTTLGHIASLPVLIEPGDAVLIDQYAHASVQTAAALLKGTPVEIVRHNRMDLLEQKLARLARDHTRVWYLLDGLYSMLGDFAPVEQLAALMSRYPKLHLYVDDAHSTSWMGEHGRGLALGGGLDRERLVVALSLNKAFSAAGGALVFPNAELRGKVRRCGGPMIFSGPVQPPMLGAAVASARLHLDGGFAALQGALTRRIHLAIELAHQERIALASEAESPIFFVRCGPSETAFRLVQNMRARGFYLCPSVFPAVPQNQAGARFTVSLHNSEQDLRALMAALGEEVRAAGLGLPDSGWKDQSTVRLVLSQPPQAANS